MDFSSPKPRRDSEPALPMINVVFLLLVFFLMSAQIVTPPPVEVMPPETRHGESARSDLYFHISRDGIAGFSGETGDAAWAALAPSGDGDKTLLVIRADAALPAQELARVLGKVSTLGFDSVQLATVPR